MREAKNGDEAVALIQNPPASLILLMTDIHMPGRHNGIAVAQIMRQQYPRAPVIYTTGRPDALNSVGPLVKTEALVVKPFHPSQLLREAHRLLAKGTGDPGY